MLLDQEKTKRRIKVIAILCTLAFVGVLPVVMGLIVFQGGATDQATVNINEAEKRLQEKPNDIVEMAALATAYRTAQRNKDAEEILNKAVKVGPKNTRELRALVAALQSRPAKQTEVLKAYTAKNPKDAEAWYTYAVTAQGAGENLTARLALQKAITNSKKGDQVHTNATSALENLNQQTPPETPAAPVATTPAAPAPTVTTP